MRSINGGLDIKFVDDAFSVKLQGILPADEYTSAIRTINNALLECRSTNVDWALLAAGPAMLPLIPWFYRSKQYKIRRRKIMQRCVAEFNNTNTSTLVMRWETKPKRLTIWPRDEAEREMNK